MPSSKILALIIANSPPDVNVFKAQNLVKNAYILKKHLKYAKTDVIIEYIGGEDMAGVKKLVVEKTTAQKQEISVVFNYVAIHFIVSGVGYFNGKRLTAGDGFVCDLGQLCNYYPDKNDPWEYIWLIVEDGNGGGFKSYKENGYVFKFERWSELRMLCLEFSANPEKLSDGKYSESVFAIIDSYRTDFKAAMTEPATELVDKAESP